MPKIKLAVNKVDRKSTRILHMSDYDYTNLVFWEVVIIE